MEISLRDAVRNVIEYQFGGSVNMDVIALFHDELSKRIEQELGHVLGRSVNEGAEPRDVWKTHECPRTNVPTRVLMPEFYNQENYNFVMRSGGIGIANPTKTHDELLPS